MTRSSVCAVAPFWHRGSGVASGRGSGTGRGALLAGACPMPAPRAWPAERPGPARAVRPSGPGRPGPAERAGAGPVLASVIMSGTVITEDRPGQGGCRVTRDRVGGALRTPCGTVRREHAPAPRRPGGRRPGGPRWHQGGPGCWSRPPLTASRPFLLLSATGFNSNAALPDVVLTATGRATMLSERAADSNREGHDAHAAPAAPFRSTAHVRPGTQINREGTSSTISRGKASQLTPPGAWLFTVPGHPAASPGTGDRP